MPRTFFSFFCFPLTSNFQNDILFTYKCTIGMCVYIAMSIYKNIWALLVSIFLWKKATSESYSDFYGSILGMYLGIKYLLINPIESVWQSVWDAIYRKSLILLNFCVGYSNALIPQEGLRSFCRTKRWGGCFLPHWLFYFILCIYFFFP